MEQRRVVLVIVLSVVFVIALSAIAIWQFYPNPQLTKKPLNSAIADLPNAAPSTNPLPSAVPSNLPSADNGNNLNAAQSPQPTPNQSTIQNNQDVVVIYGGNSTSYTDSNGKIITIGPKSTELAVGPSQGSKKPEGTPIPQVQQENTQVKNTKKQEIQKPEVSKKPVQKIDPYFIQVMSSPKRDSIELLKRDLQVHGWNGNISSTIKDGTEYFRLRYGPFNGAAEAKKFLGYISSVNGLEKSFITK